MIRQSSAATKTAVPGPPVLADVLLAWYDRHGRTLPWRALPGQACDPYAVWLSEIMLQQTTVAAVKSYYAAFLARWPNVQALADAPVEAVMQAWAGLGYYSRARNLHACAQVVARELGGVFPRDVAGLQALPGIGPYTAAAIAAIAFGTVACVVDANVERVVSRLYAIEEPLPGAKGAIRAYAAALTPQHRPGDFAQAMMDLGATLCTPRQPACGQCPLAFDCVAQGRGDAPSFPRKAAKVARPQRLGQAFYVRRADGQVLVRTRPPRGLLGGMTELPGSGWATGAARTSALQEAPLQEAPLPLAYALAPVQVTHVFTHFALALDVYFAEARLATPAPSGHRWVMEARLDNEALPTLMRKAIAVAQGRKLERRER